MSCMVLYGHSIYPGTILEYCNVVGGRSRGGVGEGKGVGGEGGRGRGWGRVVY